MATGLVYYSAVHRQGEGGSSPRVGGKAPADERGGE